MTYQVLVVDDETAIGRSICTLLESEGCPALMAVTAADGIELATKHRPEIVLCDIRLPDQSGIEVLRHVREHLPASIVIMMTAYASVESAIEALKLGAADYLIKPILFDDLLHRIRHYLSHRALVAENEAYRRLLRQSAGYESTLVGSSRAMESVREEIRVVGPTPTTVLIRGESGTGKELIAAEIHRRSKVANGPFIAVNASAVPETLIESEIFGYRRGAFTGADRDREGMLSLARGGTLFLDEIGDFPLSLQPKLLRVFEKQEFFPLGGHEPVSVDARFIVATNRPLEEMVEDGRFRKDLYYRLNAVEIHAPPLRECRDDIPDLVRHFIDRFNGELGKSVQDVDVAAMASLSGASWEGNVRELENRIRRAMIFCEGDRLTHLDLWGHCEKHTGENVELRDAVSCFERRMIQEAVERSDGDKRAAADGLGISLATLYTKLKDPDRAERSEAAGSARNSDLRNS